MKGKEDKKYNRKMSKNNKLGINNNTKNLKNKSTKNNSEKQNNIYPNDILGLFKHLGIE